MELIPADGHCIVAGDTIVWCDPAFGEWFSHRGIRPGARFSQLFPATGEYKPGAIYEDTDRRGKKRFFAMELVPTRGQNGEKVSENVRIRNITLQRVLADISKLSTQANTSRELFEKVLWLMRDTTHYLAFAGFIARDGAIELVASKGWTEKLKSYVLQQPIAPDSPSLTGRTAYYRRQVVTAMKDYDLSPAVKSTIIKMGGEFVVITPLLDRERLVGVLTVINDKELTPADSEVLQSICGQAAAALYLKLQEEAAAEKADAAMVFANLAVRAIEDGVLVEKNTEKAEGGAMETVKAIEALMRSLNEGAPLEPIPLREAADHAITGARMLAEATDKRLDVRATGLNDRKVSPLLRFAIYEALKNSVQHSATRSVGVTVRAIKERSGVQRIEISDNGPGIPDEHKSEAFRPDKANMENPGGMGLYLIKKIARICGGRVWVEDRVHGDYAKGASLVIIIPVR